MSLRGKNGMKIWDMGWCTVSNVVKDWSHGGVVCL